MYRTDLLGAAPTCTPADRAPSGFRRALFSGSVGSGSEFFQRARLGLETWVAHRGAGIEVFPSDAPLVEGTTVALLTRQLCLWVLAACRVESVVDEPTTFGFIYATLPDHPECGYESFTVILEDGDVTFEIEAVSRPGTALVRVGAPVTQLLQRRAMGAYLAAMERWVDDVGGPTRSRPGGGRWGCRASHPDG